MSETPTVPGCYICRGATGAVYAVRLDADGSVRWLGDCDGEWLDWEVVSGPHTPPTSIAMTVPITLGVYWCVTESGAVDAVSVYFAEEEVRCRTCTGERVVRWGQPI